MILEFPARHHAPAERKISNFVDLVPTDGAIDERAADLMPRAIETVQQFSPEALASLLAYSAARLERTGFKTFRP